MKKKEKNDLSLDKDNQIAHDDIININEDSDNGNKVCTKLGVKSKIDDKIKKKANNIMLKLDLKKLNRSNKNLINNDNIIEGTINKGSDVFNFNEVDIAKHEILKMNIGQSLDKNDSRDKDIKDNNEENKLSGKKIKRNSNKRLLDDSEEYNRISKEANYGINKTMLDSLKSNLFPNH